MRPWGDWRIASHPTSRASLITCCTLTSINLSPPHTAMGWHCAVPSPNQTQSGHAASRLMRAHDVHIIFPTTLQRRVASPSLETSEAAMLKDHTRNPDGMVQVFRRHGQVPGISCWSDVYLPPRIARVQGNRSLPFIIATNRPVPQQQRGPPASLEPRKMKWMPPLAACFRIASPQVTGRYRRARFPKQRTIEPNVSITHNLEVLASPAVIPVKRTVEFQIGNGLGVLV